MNQLIQSRGWLGLFFLSLLVSACQQTPGEYTLGQKYIESQTQLAVIDTFAVSLSTVILDTVATSGTGNILVGNYPDAIFGSVISHSYFQLGVPGTADVQKTDVYDSLNLIIRYNAYSFGDTTKALKIDVYRLTGKIILNENNLITSQTTVEFDPTPIGSICYTPVPTSGDTVSIKISDVIGQDFFEKLRDNSEVMTDTDRFLNYFYGLVLRADANYAGAIVGFLGHEDAAKLILHTHRDGFTQEEIDYEFGLYNYSRQFNQFEHDLSATALNGLKGQRDALPATSTNGLAFLQGGTGLVIRVDFPSLAEILMLERGKIVEARLSLAPLENSFQESGLPDQLVLYETDKLNRKTSLVLDDAGASVVSTLNLDEMYYENTYYDFDLTRFLTAELEDSYVDPQHGLLVILPSDDLFSRLLVSKTQLKIYYLSY